MMTSKSIGKFAIVVVVIAFLAYIAAFGLQIGGKQIHNVLDEEHIKKILDIFDSKEGIEAIAKSIDNKVIADNDYNLSVSSYVEAKETRQETNIKELNDRIRKIVARENELRTEINKIIAELEEDEL